MQATRHFWATALVGLLFSLLAVGGAQPAVLIGVAGVGTWLIATAWNAARTFQTLGSELTVEYTLETATTYVDSTTTATVTVTRPAATANTPVSVTVTLPPGLQLATSTPQPLTLAAGETTATRSLPIHTTVAGQFELPEPTIELSDVLGLYTETIPTTTGPRLTVLPPEPAVHIGKGGQSYGSAFGEHSTDRPGPGIAVRELRQYTAEEDAINIDWKSTARLGEPYVRETEGETDRHTALLVDHRAATGQSAGTETPLEYIREAALAMTAGAVDAGDPLSLWTVGADGITETIAPGSTPTTYNRVRSALLALEPTGTAGRRPPSARTQSLTETLPTDSQIGETLRPYAATTARDGVLDDVFLKAVQRARQELGTGAWLVLVTTDADPAQLRESVTVATAGGAAVLVLIVPTVLFGTNRLDAISDTYEAYTEFEELRRQLDNHPRVTALEVAPRERLQTVLSSNRSTHTPTGTQ